MGTGNNDILGFRGGVETRNLPDGSVERDQGRRNASTLKEKALRVGISAGIRKQPFRQIETILKVILLALPGLSVELFRYRAVTTDDGTVEYVFEADQQNSRHAITKEKAAEIAADFVLRFYGRSAHLKRRSFEQRPFRSGWSAFRTQPRDRYGKPTSLFYCRTDGC